MESKTLKEMKASEVCKITASVLEIIENAKFVTSMESRIQECADQPGRWKIVFQKDSTNLDELVSVKAQLGEHFAINVTPKDKTTLVVTIEADSKDFMALNK
jgi:hypothetical protein